jgi:hypothetical protein
VTDPTIHEEITRLVAEEHALRSRLASGEVDDDEGQAALRRLEESLDQCWDLLRRRDARREFGEDPDATKPRDIGTVEGYLQ